MRMTERMSFEEFQEHIKSPLVGGYQLRPGQVHPTTYSELVGFMGDRLKLEGPPFTVSGLARYVFEHKKDPDGTVFDCSDMSVERAIGVLLIGDLRDPDAYVATLPAQFEAVLLPPSDIVRRLIEAER